MTSISTELPPLRAARKHGVSRFLWSCNGLASEGWDVWRGFVGNGSGWWSALCPDGSRVGALVLRVHEESALAPLRRVLSGEGHIRSSVEHLGRDKGVLQWTGALAHAAGRSAEGTIVVLPLVHPVDVASAAARAAWGDAIAEVARWLTHRLDMTVEACSPDMRWDSPMGDLSSSDGAAALVEGMVLAREGTEDWMIRAEAVDGRVAEKSGWAPRVRLQVGPMSWHLTMTETREVLTQLKSSLDALEPPSSSATDDNAK